MSKVIEITDQNFKEEVLESDVPTGVDFWASWCEPTVSDIYDKLSEEYENFKFCRIDIDRDQITAREYRVVGIPMQIFFSEGKKVDELAGIQPEYVIRDKIEDIIRRYPIDEKGKLRVTLESWVNQNKIHKEKFDKHLNRLEDKDNYNEIVEIVEEIKKSNGLLEAIIDGIL